MREFFIDNRKTFFAIFISFVSVFFVFPYFMTPGKISRTYESFLTALSSISNSDILSFNFNLFNYQTPTAIPQNNSFKLPTVYLNSTKIISPSQGHSRSVLETTGSVKSTPRPTRRPTKNILTPTKYNQVPTGTRPTIKPKPSPTPLVPPGYLRPGKGLEDIFKKAGELACVPQALLKAFVAQEAPGVLNWSDEQALFYNAYDWWHRVKEVKQVCAGYGYYTHTGLVAEDSLFAGEKCKDPFSPETANDTYSRVLGSCQMLRSYWENNFKEPTRQKLKVSQVDRRVLIDCLVGYGIHFREDTGYSGSCNGDWDMKYVAKAACVNAGGTCDYYNYCYTICNNYNKFANKNYACSGAAGLFVPGSFCQLK